MAKAIHFGSADLSSTEMWTLFKETYTIGGTLGAGRDQTVIRRAIHKESGKEVCLKIIPTLTQKKRAEAIREGEMLHVCKQKNVIEYFGTYECRSEVVLITELCHKGDLLDKVNGHGRYKEEESRKMFKQFLRSLTYIHSIGVAHRDIKLDNIFETEDGTIKLADFGFATRYYPNELFNTSCGTLSYAAPEILRPRGQVSCRPEAADVWSAGVVLYALNVGRLPFSAHEDLALVEEIKKGSFNVPSDFSADLCDLLSKMLCVNPDERYSFEEIENHKWIVGAQAPAPASIRYRSSETFSIKQKASATNVPVQTRSAATNDCAKEVKKASKDNFFKKHVFKPLGTLLA